MAKCFGELSLVKKTSVDKDFSCVSYFDDGNKVIAGNSDGLVRVYDSGTLELKNTLGIPRESSSDPTIPVTDVCPIPKRNEKYKQFFFATYTNGYVKLWNVAKEKANMTLDENRQTLGVGFSNIAPHFVTVGDDGAIYLYDEQTMSVVQTLRSSESGRKVDGHTSRVFSAVFHPKNAYEFISGGWDNTVHFWDTRKLHSLRYIMGPHICGRGLGFKPGSGKEIVTASYQKENPLQKWDYATGKLLVNFDSDMFRCMLYCGSWIEDEFIASGGTDPSLFRVTHINTNSTIGYLRNQQNGVYSMDYKIIKSLPRKSEETVNIVEEGKIKKKKKEEDDEHGVVRCVIVTGRFLLEVDANLVNK